MIAEKTVKVMGQMNETFEMQGRVYDKDGLCPAIRTFQGGGLQPKIIDDVNPIVVDVYNKKQIDGNVCGTITAHGNASPTTCGTFGIVEQPENDSHDKTGFFETAIETAITENALPGDVINAFNRTVNRSGVSPTITTRPEGKKTAILPVTENYRIRKLTPRECWRLMGFADEDFDRASSVNSNAQLYKQSGNAIVKQVLIALFSQLNIKSVKPWNERTDAGRAEMPPVRNQS